MGFSSEFCKYLSSEPNERVNSPVKISNPTPLDSAGSAFVRLVQIMDELREYCPWDRKQTFETIRSLSIEEVYELVEAIDSDSHNAICEEAGDLLLHIVFYARIARERGLWDVSDVINRLCDKLVRRHPHIYGDVQATTSEAVLRNWEDIKLSEVGKSIEGIFGGVPQALPSLVKAYRIQEKAASVGIDFTDNQQVIDKIKEEVQEFCQELISNNNEESSKVEEEFGDLLFSLVNYARRIGINPDAALVQSNQKFVNRVKYIEQAASSLNKRVSDMSPEEIEYYWQEAKSKKFTA